MWHQCGAMIFTNSESIDIVELMNAHISDHYQSITL